MLYCVMRKPDGFKYSSYFFVTALEAFLSAAQMQGDMDVSLISLQSR